MAIKLSQSLKQTQSLSMTPQLQQAIKLLTLTHLEMTNEIAREMVENPLLEDISAESSEKKTEEDYQLEKLEAQKEEGTPEDFKEESFVNKENDNFEWESYVDAFNSTSSSPPPSMAKADLDDLPNYENIVYRGMSLVDHLEWQLRMEGLSEQEMTFANEIIHSVNDDGYLSLPFEELIVKTDLSRQEAFDVLETVQRLDPVGCGSESLVDCLLAQARIQEERSPLLEKIIRHHLEDLHRHEFKKIEKSLGVNEKQIRETAKLLQSFYPKPGRLISNADTHYVVPDIYVIQVAGEFIVQVNDDGVPRLRVSNLYQSLLAKGDPKKMNDADKEANQYVQEKIRSAMWLIKSVQNRQRTIEKVAHAIVRRQQAFFKKGPRYLKPMILKDIAGEIGMHESTVSRVTSNKYMHTPIGVFELKYFFSTAIGGKAGGVDVSSEVLKIKIKELILRENPKKPLSDQKIAELLSREDVKVARRTVAKYREALGLFSSAKRKRKD